MRSLRQERVRRTRKALQLHLIFQEGEDDGRHIWLLLGALAYIAFGLLGQQLVLQDQVTPVWFASGIALLLRLVWGWRGLATVFWADIVVTLIGPTTIGTGAAVGTAIASVIEAAVAAEVFRKLSVDASLRRGYDAIAFVLVCFAGSIAGATVGISVLLLSGDVLIGHSGTAWSAWMLGDTCGTFLVAGLGLVLATHGIHGLNWRRKIAASILVTCASLIFVADKAVGLTILIPTMTFVAYNLGTLGALGGAAIVISVIIAAHEMGANVFVHESVGKLLTIQLGFLSFSITLLLLAAAREAHRIRPDSLADLRSVLKFYRQDEKDYRRHMHIEAELRDALKNDQIDCHYQPVMNMLTGLPVGCEALVRWNHPRKGLLMPGYFVEIAEQGKLIDPLFQCVLKKACKEALSWDEPLLVGVNISPQQLGPELVDEVQRTLDDYGLPLDRLVIEITETDAFKKGAESVLRDLHEIGVRLAIDDFGAGWSSFSRIMSVQSEIWAIKIDRMFVSIPEPPEHLIAAMVAMGKALKAEVLVEGVELPEHLEMLRRLGIEYIQGFHYARPMPSEELHPWLKKYLSK